MENINLTPENPDADWETIEAASDTWWGGQASPEGAPPWIEDGYQLYGRLNEPHDFDAIKLFELGKCRHIGLERAVADFYLLEAIINQIPQGNTQHATCNGDAALYMLQHGFRPKYRKNSDDLLSIWAAAHQAALYTSLAEVFRKYLHYALCGEAYYHPWTRKYFSQNEIVPHYIIWERLMRKFGGVTVADWLRRLFRCGQTTPGGNTSWSSGYGGERWAIGGDVLYWYETGECQGQRYGAKQFCDRVFSLQHNGGSILNKVSWSSMSELPDVLDAHHNSNFNYLLLHCSPTVADMWKIATGEHQATRNYYRWHVIDKVLANKLVKPIQSTFSYSHEIKEDTFHAWRTIKDIPEETLW